jgi:hypothetical protein
MKDEKEQLKANNSSTTISSSRETRNSGSSSSNGSYRNMVSCGMAGSSSSSGVWKGGSATNVLAKAGPSGDQNPSRCKH